MSKEAAKEPKRRIYRRFDGEGVTLGEITHAMVQARSGGRTIEVVWEKRPDGWPLPAVRLEHAVACGCATCKRLASPDAEP